MYRIEKKGQLDIKKKSRPIDSNVMNAEKCLKINQNESSYEERSDYC